MKLWMLRPRGKWRPKYASLFEVVVRAETEIGARMLAVRLDDKPNPWMDPALVSCVVLD